MELRGRSADYSKGEGDISWTSTCMTIAKTVNMVIFKGNSNEFGNEKIFLQKEVN